MWKRFGSDKPQQSAAGRRDSSLDERTEPQAAVNRSRLPAPYKQEVARSSRAPPTQRSAYMSQVVLSEWCSLKRHP